MQTKRLLEVGNAPMPPLEELIVHSRGECQVLAPTIVGRSPIEMGIVDPGFITFSETDEIRDRHLGEQERAKRIVQEQRAAHQARVRAERILSNRNTRKRRGGW